MKLYHWTLKMNAGTPVARDTEMVALVTQVGDTYQAELLGDDAVGEGHDEIAALEDLSPGAEPVEVTQKEARMILVDTLKGIAQHVEGADESLTMDQTLNVLAETLKFWDLLD